MSNLFPYFLFPKAHVLQQRDIEPTHIASWLSPSAQVSNNVTSTYLKSEPGKKSGGDRNKAKCGDIDNTPLPTTTNVAFPRTSFEKNQNVSSGYGCYHYCKIMSSTCLYTSMFPLYIIYLLIMRYFVGFLFFSEKVKGPHEFFFLPHISPYSLHRLYCTSKSD